MIFGDLKDYLQSFKSNLEMLSSSGSEGVYGRESFVSEFKQIAEWFGPFSDQAIRESGYLINKLIERF